MAEGFINQLQGYIGTPIEVTINGQNIGRVISVDSRQDVVKGTKGSAKISTIQTVAGDFPKPLP